MLRAAFLSLAVMAVPAFANPHFQAQPETAPAQAQFVARENVWRCGESGCTSSRSATRPAIVCAALAREVGRLRGFSVEGRAFSDEELEGCNRRAR